MQANDRLQRILIQRRLGSGGGVAAPFAGAPDAHADLKLFAMTFAAGFLFTSIFIA